jgi:hypothetical protein
LNKLKVVVSKEEIQKKVAELAADISRDYGDKNPVLIGALKGSFVFMSDLILGQSQAGSGAQGPDKGKARTRDRGHRGQRADASFSPRLHTASKALVA